jgi:hypothetical protein
MKQNISKEQKAALDMFNALWTDFHMGETYCNWRANSSLDKDTIVIHKCAALLPKATMLAFREVYSIVNKIERE